MEKIEGQLTVSELIDLLRKMPQDFPVWTEGCDCYGEAGGVILGEEAKDVTITRL